MRTRLPGIKAMHCVVSDNCRRAHGDAEAFDQAVARMKAKYLDVVKARRQRGDDGVQYHIVLTIDGSGVLEKAEGEARG